MLNEDLEVNSRFMRDPTKILVKKEVLTLDDTRQLRQGQPKPLMPLFGVKTDMRRQLETKPDKASFLAWVMAALPDTRDNSEQDSSDSTSVHLSIHMIQRYQLLCHTRSEGGLGNRENLNSWLLPRLHLCEIDDKVDMEKSQYVPGKAPEEEDEPRIHSYINILARIKKLSIPSQTDPRRKEERNPYWQKCMHKILQVLLKLHAHETVHAIFEGMQL